ncbi:hypothetical protein Bbelb_208120 [Branchiostoma belcheri]|nr:hypothetical protein Bbelb_208120 [Branchiostoma belcheri]
MASANLPSYFISPVPTFLRRPERTEMSPSIHYTDVQRQGHSCEQPKSSSFRFRNEETAAPDRHLMTTMASCWLTERPPRHPEGTCCQINRPDITESGGKSSHSPAKTLMTELGSARYDPWGGPNEEAAFTDDIDNQYNRR